MKDVYQVKDVVQDHSVEITYSRPKLGHRILANLVDIFIFVITAILLFIGVRSIIQITPYYKGVMNRTYELQLESGLYVKVDKEYQDIAYYIDKHIQLAGSNFDGDDEEVPTKNGTASKAINTFITFTKDNAKEERYNERIPRGGSGPSS